MKVKVFIYFIVLYVLVALFSLNFNFIEGDDATTLMYHFLDRQPDIQPQYSSYHSMFDTFLSVLDATNEKQLRIVSILICFIFGLISLFALAQFIYLKNGNNDKASYVALLLLPFILPEVLFSSLLINPTLIAISLLILSHIFLLYFLKKQKNLFLLLSILCFGLGVSFRWICGFYIFLLFGEYVMFHGTHIKNMLSQFLQKKSVVIALLYVVSMLIFLYLSGYSIIDIYTSYKDGNAYMNKKEVSLISYAATAITFLTPSVLFLCFAGFVNDFKTKNYQNSLLFFIGLLPYFMIGLFPSYKYMITLIVPIVLLIISGLKLFRNTYFKIALFVLIFAPWFIGLQIESNSAWGPGFSIKSKATHNIDIDADFNPDKTLSLNNVKVVLKSGVAMPTLEGPRPLFGFSYCLLKEWKGFVEELNSQRTAAVSYAEANELNILQDVKHSFMTTKLVELGYTTKEPLNHKIGDNLERNFFKFQDTISVCVLKRKKDLFSAEKIKTLSCFKSEIVIYSSYTNIISKLKTKYTVNFEQKSAYWGVLKI